jgi:hypothetical protein
MNKELLAHWDELRLLFRGGKLSRKEGWRNVIEHQVTQLLGAIELGNLLGLSVDDKRKFETGALVHDWKKRLDKHRKEFSSDEAEKIKIFLNRVNPDLKLMAATGPEFLERVLCTEVSLLEFLQFYLDDITRGNEIVPFDERIDEVSVRRHDLNENTKLTERLGGRKYWDLEREVGHAVEKRIFDRLIVMGVEIDSPEKIPALIRNRIEEKLNV